MSILLSVCINTSGMVWKGSVCVSTNMYTLDHHSIISDSTKSCMYIYIYIFILYTTYISYTYCILYILYIYIIHIIYIYLANLKPNIL